MVTDEEEVQQWLAVLLAAEVRRGGGAGVSVRQCRGRGGGVWDGAAEVGKWAGAGRGWQQRYEGLVGGGGWGAGGAFVGVVVVVLMVVVG